MPELPTPGPPTPHVLLVAGTAEGGIRAHLTLLARHLARRGWRATVVAPEVTLAPLRADPPPNVRLVAAPVGSFRSGSFDAGHRAVRRLARDADVVHTHGLRAGAVTAAARPDVPVIHTWHNAPSTRGPARAVHAALERLTARGSALVLAVSPDLADRARRAGAPAVELVEVPPAELAGDRQAARGKLRRVLNVGPAQPLVLSVARLDPQKGLETLVAAASAWRGAADPTVVVAGDGPLRRELQARIDQTGAPVRLLGHRPDIPDLLAAADVAVLASRWEGWPLAAAEAIAADVPLVATDVPGTRRLAGEAAVFVPVADAQALRAAVERVVQNSQLRQRLVAAGRTRRAEWQSLDEANDALLARYLTLK